MSYLLVALLGLVAGVVSGLFGVGGAIVIVPGLVLLAKLPQHTANGTSLAVLMLPVGILGFLQYYKRDQVNLSYAAFVALGLFFGALIGGRVAGMLPEPALRRAFAVLLLLVAGKLLFTK